MANENLGASFSIDITNLKAGLAQANRLIRESESQFREAAAGMDDWSSSARGLEMRSDSLNKQIELQSAKVDALVRAKQDVIKKMTEEGKSQEEIALAVDSANKNIEKESKQLDRLKSELKKNDKALEDFSDESDNAAESVEDVGNEAKNTEGGFTVMKGAIANLISTGITALVSACGEAISSIAGLAESTREYRRDMSAFTQNAENAGVSIDTMKDKLIEVGAVTGEADAALEGMNMLMATGMDTSNIEYAADAFAGAASKFSGLKFEGLAEGLQETLATGAAVGPFAELIERTGVDLESFNKGMENCKTAAERQAYAMQFLTESGLAEANEAFKEMNKSIIEAEEAEARYTEAMAELGAIAEPIMTTLKNLATELVQEVTPFVSLIADGLSGALSGTAGAADSLSKGLGGILDMAVSKVSDVLPFVIDMLVDIVPELVTTLLSAVTDALPVLVDAVVELVPLLISSLLSMLPQLLTAVIDMVLAIANGLSAMLPTIVSAVMAVLPQLINSLIASIPQLLQAAVTLLMAIVDAIPVIVTVLIEALPDIIDTIITALLDSIPILLDAAISMLTAIVDAIPTIVDALVDALPMIIDSIITGLLEALPQLMNASITLFFAIIDSIPTIVRSLYGAMPQIINTIMTSILNALPRMFSTANQLFSQIGAAISKFVGEVPGKMGEVISTMLSGLSESLSSFFDIGADIVRGIWDGINGNFQWIKNKIKDWVGNVVQFIKDLFGIESPSKVMRDEVGKYVAEGIGVGFEQNIGEVNSLVEDSLANNPVVGQSSSSSSSRGLASGSTGGVTVYQTNNYSQAHSRYELWQSKEQTASAVKLAMMGV